MLFRSVSLPAWSNLPAVAYALRIAASLTTAQSLAGPLSTNTPATEMLRGPMRVQEASDLVVALSPRGTEIMGSVRPEGEIRWWHYKLGTELWASRAHGSVGITAMEFAPDGSVAATADRSGEILLWGDK